MKKKSMGGYKAQLVKAGMGIAVGAGFASLAQKLPYVGQWAGVLGIFVAYSAAGSTGAVAYAVASGALGNIGAMVSSVAGGATTATTGSVF